MDLISLKKKIKEFEDDAIKEKYINAFVDTSKDYYQSRIVKKNKFSDGYYYTGYLRDTLYLDNGYKLLSEDEFYNYKNVIDKVYVFWDLHSEDHQLYKERYWNFNRNSILSLTYSTLLVILDYLPEDIYIFDEKLQWTIIPTHGDIDGQQVIIMLGNI